MLKALGPLARLFQFIMTFFLGGKMARDRNKLKNAKAKNQALVAKIEVDGLTDDEVEEELSKWQK